MWWRVGDGRANMGKKVVCVEWRRGLGVAGLQRGHAPLNGLSHGTRLFRGLLGACSLRHPLCSSPLRCRPLRCRPLCLTLCCCSPHLFPLCCQHACCRPLCHHSCRGGCCFLLVRCPRLLLPPLLITLRGLLYLLSRLALLLCQPVARRPLCSSSLRCCSFGGHPFRCRPYAPVPLHCQRVCRRPLCRRGFRHGCRRGCCFLLVRCPRLLLTPLLIALRCLLCLLSSLALLLRQPIARLPRRPQRTGALRGGGVRSDGLPDALQIYSTCRLLQRCLCQLRLRRPLLALPRRPRRRPLRLRLHLYCPLRLRLHLCRQLRLRQRNSQGQLPA